MRQSIFTSVATIYRPVCIDGRWYAKNLNNGEISKNLSFENKMLSEMICANLMGLKASEARLLWLILGNEESEKDAQDVNAEGADIVSMTCAGTEAPTA